MGLFTNSIPDLGDSRLRDFRFLLQPIERLYRDPDRWTLNLDEIAVTVANRLAHLTDRMEREPCDPTCQAAKWYLANLVDIDIVPRAVPVVDPLKQRLQAAITAYETWAGYTCDLTPFARLVGHTDTERCQVLYGPPMWRGSDECAGPGGPLSTLGRGLSAYCWKWASIGRF